MAKKLNGLHYNNILLYGEKQKHVAWPKARAMSADATVNVYFQALDRMTATPQPSEIVAPLTGISVPGNYTVKDLLDNISDYRPSLNLTIDYTEGTETGPIFIEGITIADGDVYEECNNNGSGEYDPDTGLYTWTGTDWMYAFAAGGIPNWDPDDDTQYDPSDPANTGKDDYPEAAVNQVTIAQIAAKKGACNITFGFETHQFEYVLEEQTVNGVRMMTASLVR